MDVDQSGEFTLTTVAGKGWLYIEGPGWSDSIPFVAAEGMKLFIEAWANASSSGGVYAIIKELIDAMGGATEQELQDLVQQAKMYADAASRASAAESVWDKGMISAKTDILSLAPGRYGLTSGAVASSMGLPGNAPGVLIVDYLDGPNGRLYGRFWWEHKDNTYGRIRYSATSYNGSFSGWLADNTWHKMPLTTSDKLVELPPGRYPVVSEDVAKAQGLPWSGMGYLEMEWLGTSAFQRVDWWTGVNPTHHWRISIYNKSMSAATWEHLHGADTGEDEANAYQLAGADAAIEAMITTHDPTNSYVADHAALVGDLKRRIGPVNVGEAGALALVFDHGTTAFRDWVWPELKKRNLVGTMALCPEVHLDGKGDSRHRATNDEIKAWIGEGLAIASHSGDHGGAKTTTDLYRQIVVSKQALETKLDTKVDCWVQPGYSLEGGNYKGFGTGQLATDYTDTMAGRLLQQTYPVITGYVGDDYLYPMQELPVGVQRSLMERKDSVAQVRDYVQQAADQGLKHISFIHPYVLVDESDTYATKQDYIDLLDLVVQLRDTGKLKVLTLPQLAIAEK
ncbi:hypothetical protein HMPREF3147_01100 [Corynebacterium sp. HMSC05D03]|nr:hypothetical protein HMPREF3147_01100 [Corynebacterium sp. HMSC05D03]